MSDTRIILDHAALGRLDRAAVTALEKTGEWLHGEIVNAQVIPQDQGTLQGTAFTVDRTQSAKGTVELVNSTPYARRLYYHPEYKFHREPWTDKDGEHLGNPNAGGDWFKDWADGGRQNESVVNAFKTLYRQEAAHDLE